MRRALMRRQLRPSTTPPHARELTLEQDSSLDASISRLTVWLAALVKGRRSSFSVFANALTPDSKLVVIQAQALKSIQASKNADVERAAAVCLRRIDVGNVYTCNATSSESTRVIPCLPRNPLV